MDIRILNATEFEASKELWKRCFGDGDRFVDLYYRARSKPEYVLGAFGGGRLVSMLHMIPVKMRFDGALREVCIVAGVCTDPGYRRRGICSALFERAFGIMDERGFYASVLQPFREDFYARLGYRTFIFRRRITMPCAGMKPKNTATPDPEKLAELYRNFMRPYDGASVRDADYFRGFIEEYSAEDARLIVTENACLAGYAEGKTFTATELFFKGRLDISELVPEGFETLVFPLPEDRPVPEGCADEREAFSMMRPFVPGSGKTYGFDRY